MSLTASSALDVSGASVLPLRSAGISFFSASAIASGRVRAETVSKDEPYLSFADGWRVDSIDEARMIVTFAPDGAFAWRAVLTRRN